MTPGSAGELRQALSEALNAWRSTGQDLLVVMFQVHPSERHRRWDTTTQKGIQLELIRRVGKVVSAQDLFALDTSRLVVVSRGVVGADEARRLAERITSEASLPSGEDTALPILLSSGAVLNAGRHSDSEALLAEAENAMRRAATVTGTQLVFLDGPLWPHLVDRFGTLSRSGDSDADGLRVVYQPIVTAVGRSLWGVEALLRWESAVPARRSALDLVHAAEQTGWMEPLGRWVMREATSGTRGSTLSRASDLMVFVNVSASQLSSPTFIEDVDETFRITGVDPTQLGLDIPSIALSNKAALEAIDSLRARGVTIALDDFEIKAPMLRSLEEIPVDVVKLDATAADLFGADSARSLLVGIVSWAHQIGLTVIAKNIEARARMTLAVEVGCNYLQGFLISPPREEVDTWRQG